MKNLDSCSLCGTCQTVCPVYAQSGEEGDGPRGKMALLKNVQAGKLKLREAEYRLKRCLFCGQCARACPANLPLEQIFLSAREKLPKDSSLFLAMLAHPKIQDLGGKARISSLINALPEKIRPALWPAEKLKTYASPAKGRKKIAFFQGCIAGSYLPRITTAAIKALEYNNYEIIVPHGLKCCGRPLLAHGQKSAAHRAILANIRILEKMEFDFLVSPCPGCVRTIKTIWREVSKDALPVASRCMEITALIDKALPPGEANVFWHDACLSEDTGSLQRISGSRPGGAYKGCCGGSLSFSGNPLANELGISLRDEILSAGKKTVVTSCPGCVLRLEKLLAPADIRVLHAMEYYQEKFSVPDDG